MHEKSLCHLSPQGKPTSFHIRRGGWFLTSTNQARKQIKTAPNRVRTVIKMFQRSGAAAEEAGERMSTSSSCTVRKMQKPRITSCFKISCHGTFMPLLRAFLCVVVRRNQNSTVWPFICMFGDVKVKSSHPLVLLNIVINPTRYQDN